MTYSILEWELNQRGERYELEQRYVRFGDDGDWRCDAVDVSIDFQALYELHLSPKDYGKALGGMLLRDQRALEFVNDVLRSTQGISTPLRLLLLLDPDAPELHSLRWETLRLPGRGGALTSGNRVLFSRYLSRTRNDWGAQPAPLRQDLRALVVIANPSDLAGAGYPPIDVAGELARARAALGPFVITELATPRSATLTGLVQAVAKGQDLVYLVAHGTFRGDQSSILLEHGDGSTWQVSGAELAEQIGVLQPPPRMMVLASCQSVGTGESQVAEQSAGVLNALGPLLINAGVDAVVGMHGQISAATVGQFMPALFDGLVRTGQIDLAMGMARLQVEGQFDAWMPSLWMRLYSGRLWRMEEAASVVEPSVRPPSAAHDPDAASGAGAHVDQPQRAVEPALPAQGRELSSVGAPLTITQLRNMMIFTAVVGALGILALVYGAFARGTAPAPGAQTSTGSSSNVAVGTLSIPTAPATLDPTVSLAVPLPTAYAVPTAAPTAAIVEVKNLTFIDKPYDLDLDQYDMAIGDTRALEGDDNNGRGCIVFYERGPFRTNFMMNKGSYRVYKDIYTQDQVDYLINDRKWDLVRNLDAGCVDEVIVVRRVRQK